MDDTSAPKRGDWGEGGAPPPGALHVERVVDRFSGKTVIGSIRHPGHAWCAELPELDDAAWTAWIQHSDFFERIGFAYLVAAAQAAGLQPGRRGWIHPDLWARLAPAGPPRGLGFGWLKCTWTGPRDSSPLSPGEGPLGSIWIDRGRTPDERRGAMILLAGNVDTEFQLQFGADLGLRIVIHVAEGQAVIRGVTVSSLCTDRAMAVVPEGMATLLQPGGLHAIKESIGRTLVRGPVQEGNQALAGHAAVWIHNIERSLGAGSHPNLLNVSGLAARARAAGGPLSRRRIHDFRVQVAWNPDGSAASVLHVHRDDYIGSHATAPAWTRRDVRAFEQDGASQGPLQSLTRRRPTRTAQDLEDLRVDVPLYLNWYPHGKTPSGRSVLRLSNPRPWFETRTAEPGHGPGTAPPTVDAIMQGPVELRGGSAPLGGAKPVDVEAAPILSDKQGSIQTHLRASELFFRLEAYGLDPEAYFRFARLPLVQRARPAMTWAPDGELPNAEVRPFIGEARIEEPGDAAGSQVAPQARLRDRVQLLVRYGSASPFHRHKGDVAAGHGKPPGHGAELRRKAQYLSIACDPRWAWHEFGHVLAYAGTGELELPFAHGAGDGLAAIASDPRSALAGDPEAPERFITYPWIEVPGRSHGRRPGPEGYCWCGARNLVRLNFTAPLERYHHGYFGEQLMSSSLFRLYRSLGGDTRGKDPESDLAIRLEASDYCIYLVMVALSLLGPDSVAPAQTPDQFVAALIEADLGTGDWQVEARWPFSIPVTRRRMVRRGGRVHKVIRWAFERQGLYATAEPREIAEGPGNAPAVDVYIADQRPHGGPDGGPGAYAPVPLHARHEDASDSLWLAAPDAVLRQDGRLVVNVHNRGRTVAHDLTARAWVGESAAGPWLPLSPVAQANEVCRPGKKAVSLGFELGEAAKWPLMWVLASADAPADPSNLGPRQTPPIDAAALRELVAHDNNLALARLTQR